MAKKSTSDADFIAQLRRERGSDEAKPETAKTGMVMNHPPDGPGKSLDELLQESAPDTAANPNVVPAAKGAGAHAVEVEIAVDLIDLSPYQPRLKFDEDALRRLADSIAADGQINPIVVRRRGARYELIGGERRWRAVSQLLHHPTIKAVVRELPDADAAVMALTDNEAREDLSDFERARTYKQLLDAGTVASQSDLARRTGKERTFIVRCLAFFRLPREAIALLNERPDFISASSAGFFAAFMEPNDGSDADLVLEALRKIFDGKLDATNALNWLKAQVKARYLPEPADAGQDWMVDGKRLGRMRVEGRKLVISCANGVTPDELINRILLAAKQ